MRLLVLTSLYPNPLQPHRATFNRQETAALAARHRVAVIAPVAWTDECALRLRGRPPLPRGRRTTLDGVETAHPRYLFPPRVLRGQHGRCFLASARPAFVRAVRDHPPDLIYAHWAYPDGWAAVELAREAKLPVVVKVHGSDLRLLDGYPGRRRGTVEALQGADAVVAVSRDLATRVCDLGVDPDRVHVIYAGVDPARFSPGDMGAARRRLGLPADGPVLLFVGNLLPVKGPDLLIESCTRLARSGMPFTCVLAGQGPLARRLARQVNRAGLRGRVRLLGPVPHERLPDWYRAADLMVLPSRSEGVPTVLLEAAACGTPAVAARVGGIPEVAHLGAVRLVPPEDAGALADAIRDGLSSGPGRVRPAAAAAPRRCEDAAADHEALFARVLRRAGRPAAPTAPDGVPAPPC